MLFRRACLFVLFACVSVISRAQIVVKNQFVAGDVEPATGILTIRDVVNGKVKDYLTNPGHSYLSLSVNGLWFTNNMVGGQNLVGNLGGGGAQVTPIFLDGGSTKIIGDTIQTTWQQQGGTFDIVQEVYPVAFRASGQIVWRVKIVNHSQSPISVEGIQYLNDLQANTNDNPYLIERNYYDGNHWRVASKDGTNPNPPSFYIEIEHDPLTLNLGSMGAGFTNDSFPPSPMGLTPCSGFAVGSWQLPAPNQMLDYLFGCPPPPSSNITSDLACALQWKPTTVPAARTGSDTTIEEFRTSFGTQEFCMCLGNAISINVYPTHLLRDHDGRHYPNPFPALSMIYNIQGNDFTNVYAKHFVSAPLQIVSGAATIHGSTIKSGEMQTFLWADSLAALSPTNTDTIYLDMGFNLLATGYSGAWDCSQPGNHNGSCDIQVDPAFSISAQPTKHILSRTGSYDKSLCNARKTTMQVYDTGGKASIKSIYYTSTNMTATIPSLTQPLDTVTYTVQVVDSMQDGIATFLLSDVLGNNMYDTVRYCTILDTTRPVIDAVIPTGAHSRKLHISDSAAWNRGLKYVKIYGGENVKGIPSDSVWLGCLSSFDFEVQMIDSNKLSCFQIQVVDCAVDGNVITSGVICMGGNEDVTGLVHPGISISPNPTSDKIEIVMPADAAEIATLQNLLGRTVLQQTIRGTGDLDLSKLAAGTYILRVGGVTRKIIKE